MDNIRKAGLGHWLIIPKVGSSRHIRDCEALTEEDIPLRKPKAHSHSALSSISYQFGKEKKKALTYNFFSSTAVKALEVVKEKLLRKHFPNIQCSAVLAGFHRGRRHFYGPVIFPDIVSIHHLHLHVIIEPFLTMALFKYPSWFPLMWVSDRDIMERVKGRKRIEPACSANEASA